MIIIITIIIIIIIIIICNCTTCFFFPFAEGSMYLAPKNCSFVNSSKSACSFNCKNSILYSYFIHHNGNTKNQVISLVLQLYHNSNNTRSVIMKINGVEIVHAGPSLWDGGWAEIPCVARREAFWNPCTRGMLQPCLATDKISCVNLMGIFFFLGGGRRHCLWSKIWKSNSHNWPR